MSDPFVAEIRMFAGNFAPVGWALCNGQLLPISQNTALFSLLGTNYGGDGRSTFGLPNLQGAAPVHQGAGPGLSPRDVGETGGQQFVTLLQSEIPAHTHTVEGVAVSSGLGSPAGNVWGTMGRGRGNAYVPSDPATNVSMSPLATSVAGGGQPHNNMPPYLTLTFMIALLGVFPARG